MIGSFLYKTGSQPTAGRPKADSIVPQAEGYSLNHILLFFHNPGSNIVHDATQKNASF